jgi:hypothetical protein
MRQGVSLAAMTNVSQLAILLKRPPIRSSFKYDHHPSTVRSRNRVIIKYEIFLACTSQKRTVNTSPNNAAQKVRRSVHTSFSFFGPAFTFITGALIIVASYATEPILACLHRRRKYKPYAYLEWVSNSSLQLHRLAHEEVGPNPWSNCDKQTQTTTAPDDPASESRHN